VSSALRAIRPEPHRGELVAAGGVVLAVAIGLLNQRMGNTWGHGVLFVLDATAAALLLAMGLLADPEWHEEAQQREGITGTGPSVAARRVRGYIGVLLLSGFAIGVLALTWLARVLGADSAVGSSGASLWVSVVLALGGFALWRARAVTVFVLVAAVLSGVAALTFVTFAFHPHGVGGYRIVLLLLLLGFAALHGRMRESRRREAVLLVDAAGLAALAIAVTIRPLLGIELGRVGGSVDLNGPVAWQLVALVAGCLLVAFAAVEREPGPGFLGVAVLVVFVAITGLADPGGASVDGWPLLLLLLAGVVIGAGLRPSPPLPPEPGARAETVSLPTLEPPA
jgi:hypothetical protein